MPYIKGKVFAYIPDKDSFEPELMYKLFTNVCISLEELIRNTEIVVPLQVKR